MLEPRVGVRTFSFAQVVFKKVIKHFYDILFWARTVIRMTTMIKLRHQQPSLWHRGLAEDIEGLWEPWMGCWKTSHFWTRCTKPKENVIRRAAAVAECKPRRKYCCACCC